MLGTYDIKYCIRKEDLLTKALLHWWKKSFPHIYRSYSIPIAANHCHPACPTNNFSKKKKLVASFS